MKLGFLDLIDTKGMSEDDKKYGRRWTSPWLILSIRR